MIPKDWIKDAARDLARFYRHGRIGPDDYVTDKQRAEVAEYYEKIIKSHCPMQQDVVYMPVPRCDQCNHWDHMERTIEDTSECLLPTMSAKIDVARSDGDTFHVDFHMRTREDFGCVSWEAK